MKYTLGTASAATGKSKSTILRAIKSRKISAIQDENGSWQIDPAELFRCFDPVPESEQEARSMAHHATPIGTGETAALWEKINGLEARLEREQKLNAELSRRLDLAETDRQRQQQAQEKAFADLAALTLRITHQPPPTKPEAETAPEKSGLMQKLFGRKS